MTEYAYAQGFKGQILSCTLDHYDALVAKTSLDFMEGVTFQFPDFDDPELSEKAFFFNQPNVFYEQYNNLYPGSWSAVSWEYAAILDIWHAAVQKAGSVNPVSVLAAMKQLGHVTHAFGPADWWGRRSSASTTPLVGDWPVVTIQNGKARIVSFGSVPDWLSRHSRAVCAAKCWSSGRCGNSAWAGTFRRWARGRFNRPATAGFCSSTRCSLMNSTAEPTSRDEMALNNVLYRF